MKQLLDYDDYDIEIWTFHNSNSDVDWDQPSKFDEEET